MEKNDKITLVVFIFLVIAIIFMIGFNVYKNKKLENVDRKVEYIMGYSYNTVLNKGEELFFQTISLLNDKDVFEYEKTQNNSIKTYAINDITNYIKIKNFSLATNTFSNKSLKEYMDYKKIIIYDDHYYIENFNEKTSNYIGSSIDIESYNNNKVYFKSTNYYCDNTEFIGNIVDLPNCDYEKEETMFSVIVENNLLRIFTIKDFIEI